MAARSCLHLLILTVSIFQNICFVRGAGVEDAMVGIQSAILTLLFFVVILLIVVVKRLATK